MNLTTLYEVFKISYHITGLLMEYFYTVILLLLFKLKI